MNGLPAGLGDNKRGWQWLGQKRRVIVYVNTDSGS
jgi:hypothetical protein